MKRTAWFGFAILLMPLQILPQTKPSPSPAANGAQQRFVCNTGYTLEECRAHIALLKVALAKYPATDLGDWTWVLVRSADWKAILLPRGLDPDSPAFTFYPKRETFIEEALVTQVPGRGRELLLKWNMSINELLDVAIGHELGHALCNDKDERNANQVGQLLRDGKALSCGNLQATTHTRQKASSR